MRGRLLAYNARLAKTFIDIPELDAPAIPLAKGGILPISDTDKFVRRIFNRGSWGCGGRFYGGWWQRCPKAWRAKIFINDQPTIEDDYSGLHIVMLYARVGIDYWSTVAPEEDPYEVKESLALSTIAVERRAYAKGLLLMAINAGSDKAAFNAFRSDMKDQGNNSAARFTNVQLAAVLDALKAKHGPIAEFIGADIGITLMNQDAKITDEVIGRFVRANRPILTLHDSYIVMFGDDQRLRIALQEAFELVTGVSGVHLKRVP